MMMTFEKLRKTPEFRPLAKLAAAVLAVWAAAILMAAAAAGFIGANTERADETALVADMGTAVKSYPQRAMNSSQASLANVSSMIETLALRDKAGQISSTQTGFIMEFSKLYPAEFTKLVETVRDHGLSVKTADVKAMPSDSGRLINVVLELEAAR